MKIRYLDKGFTAANMARIAEANSIIAEYELAGLGLTLRQLYYQFVARDLIANTQQEYKRLGNLISNARLAGLVDWRAIEDRGRSLRGVSTWDSPAEIIEVCARQYRIDRWATQPVRIEVWVEKEALIGVVGAAAHSEHVPAFACKGYTSQSSMWEAGQRLAGYIQGGQEVLIIHMGDHDPSGIDMTRDIRDRLDLFVYYHTQGTGTVDRIALNFDQVEQYSPPPNPTKLTDSRAGQYLEEHGDESWELDALEPAVMRDLIVNTIVAQRDDAAWATALEREEHERQQLADVAADMADE